MSEQNHAIDLSQETPEQLVEAMRQSAVLDAIRRLTPRVQEIGRDDAGNLALYSLARVSEDLAAGKIPILDDDALRHVLLLTGVMGAFVANDFGLEDPSEGSLDRAHERVRRLVDANVCLSHDGAVSIGIMACLGDIATELRALRRMKGGSYVN